MIHWKLISNQQNLMITSLFVCWFNVTWIFCIMYRNWCMIMCIKHSISMVVWVAICEMLKLTEEYLLPHVYLILRYFGIPGGQGLSNTYSSASTAHRFLPWQRLMTSSTALLDRQSKTRKYMYYLHALKWADNSWLLVHFIVYKLNY